jgi:PAS domain S-box-containing protein
MHLLNDPLFISLFDTDVPRVILNTDYPNLTIFHCNPTYTAATGNTIESIQGKSLWDIYNPKDAGGDGEPILKEALHQAILTQQTITTAPFHYNIKNPDGQLPERWWKLEIVPVSYGATQPKYLMVTTIDITSSVLADRTLLNLKQNLSHSTDEMAAIDEELSATNEQLSATIDELNLAQEKLKLVNQNLEVNIAERIQELAESESSLRSLIMSAHYPLMILRGRDWIIEIANQPLVNLWDKTMVGVTGHKLMDILPEIEDQPFPKFLRQVYDSGVGYGQEEEIFHYDSPTGPAVKYVSFYYDPLFDDQGIVSGIIVAADDITEKVKARTLLQESYEQQQTLNEEYTAINEELATTIEELSESNEELLLSQKNLEVKNLELADSEGRFRSLIRQAPVGICVIRATDLMVQEVNDSYLELVGKTREELEHKTIWEAVAEAAESYAPVMDEVITSGEAFIANEHELFLLRNGIPTSVFVDFVYEPVLNADGAVIAIMVVGIEVTDKVLARRKIEDVEERIRLAVEAAEIGTYDYDFAKDLMITSARHNAIFGFEKTTKRRDYQAMIHPDDLEIAAKAHIQALETGKLFYEARIILEDQPYRWIRAQGSYYFDKNKQPARILGTILDITDYKMLQQQKDDFISIASHELKTPITALKASLQLLDRMKKNPATPMFPKLIEQSTRSMGKISELVEDLLNVSRMNEGQIQLNKSAFIISEMLNSCCNHVRIEGKYDLVFEGEATLQIFADEHRIDQVIVNLVNNAVKYAPNSKTIHLVAEDLGAAVRIAVKDHGPGIAPEKVPHLFDRYYRADQTGIQVSGLGLGLYISADIIHRHGGTIGVDSVLGEGSSFWFILPKQQN